MKFKTAYHKLQLVRRTYEFDGWQATKKALETFKKHQRQKDVGSVSIDLYDLGKERYKIVVEYAIIN